MVKKPSDEIRTEYDLKKLDLSALRFREVFSFLKQVVKYVFLGFLVWTAGVTLSGMAGTSTAFDFAFQFLADISLPEWFSLAFGACGIGYGAFERRHRKLTTKRLSNENRQLQTIIDPGRMSSGVMPDGSVPGDAL